MKNVVIKVVGVASFLACFAVLQSCSGSSAAGGSSPASCPVSGVTASSGTINLKSDCQIVGNVQLSGSAILNMTGGVLSIQGNLALGNNAQLNVANGGLTFPQSAYNQFSITLNNSALLKLTNSALITNGTQQNNFSMTLNAYNSSRVAFDHSTLQTEGGSWLLGNFHDQSQLSVVSSHNLPTEVYPFDASQLSVTSQSSFATIWLDFVKGSSGTVNVPQKDAQGNYSLDFGNSPGFGYSVHIASSSGRLGLNSHPQSSMIVNGQGASGTNDADLVFGYYIENSTGPVSIDGLSGGADITHQWTDQGRTLQLNHVNLNPFVWQVYVSQSNGFPVTITNSKINELGALTNGLVNLSGSTLQLAVTEAGGPGSQINISNTQIWSQTVMTQNGGQIAISGSQLHGNFLSANGAGSSIAITNTVDGKNATPPTTCAPVNGIPPNVNGVPVCNPFNPLYQCSQVKAQNGGAITGTPACTSTYVLRRQRP